jgi:hypothetical protein
MLAEVKGSTAEGPMDLYVVTHDCGNGGPGRVSNHYFGRVLETLAKQLLSVLQLGSSSLSRSTPRLFL